MSTLSTRRCVPLPKGTPALAAEHARRLLTEIPGWAIDEQASTLRREFTFQNYAHAVGFTNLVAFLSERQDHHPDLEVGWGRCVVRYSTHSVGGLSENDFICAAKINALVDLAG